MPCLINYREVFVRTQFAILTMAKFITITVFGYSVDNEVGGPIHVG